MTRSHSTAAKLGIVLLLASPGSMFGAPAGAEGVDPAGPIQAGVPTATELDQLPAVPVNLCLLWQDEAKQIVHTDRIVMRECLDRPGPDQCEWESRADVPAAKAIELASQGLIRIDADADPPLQARLDLTTFKVKDLPEECESMAAAALLAAPGLSTAAKIGLGLGAGAGGILLGDADDEPVSASRP